MKRFIDIEKKGFIFTIHGSSCWVHKGKPVLFNIRRKRLSPHSDGWVWIHFGMFYILSVNLAWRGKIL